MMFLHAWVLLLVLLVPILLYVRYLWRGRRFRVRYPEAGLLEGLPRGVRAVLWPVLPVLFAGGLFLVVLAMARPQQGLQESVISRDVIDIAIVVDVSGSMQALDFSEGRDIRNRLDAAREVVGRFIDSRENDRICIIAFSGVPYTLAPLTLDHDWLLAQLARLQIGMLREDGTAIGSALGTAVARLERSEAASKVVVLLTDGINNSGLITPEEAAQLAQASDIKVYAVGAGRKGEVPMPTRGGGIVNMKAAEIDEAMLRGIADSTGGAYFRAEDFESLQAVYDTIDEMERTEIQEAEYTHFEDRSAWFLVPGLCLLLLEGLLGASLFRRLTA